MLTERSLLTYSNFGIEPRCRVCGKKFKVGDRVIKTRVRAGKDENPFYCPEHFYTEKGHRRRLVNDSQVANRTDRKAQNLDC